MDVALRMLREDDVPAVTRLLVSSRSFLVPWVPERTDEYFTEEFQHRDVARLLDLYRQGAVLPGVVLLGGEPVGRITVSNIVRGAFQSGDLGYWVAEAVNGRGVASAAVAAMVHLAFDEVGLHRLQAGTLLHNRASQRVLERNGFARFGLAPRYLRIAGEWQDHVLFQRLNEPTVGARVAEASVLR